MTSSIQSAQAKTATATNTLYTHIIIIISFRVTLDIGGVRDY